MGSFQLHLHLTLPSRLLRKGDKVPGRWMLWLGLHRPDHTGNIGHPTRQPLKRPRFHCATPAPATHAGDTCGGSVLGRLAGGASLALAAAEEPFPRAIGGQPEGHGGGPAGK